MLTLAKGLMIFCLAMDTFSVAARAQTLTFKPLGAPALLPLGVNPTQGFAGYFCCSIGIAGELTSHGFMLNPANFFGNFLIVEPPFSRGGSYAAGLNSLGWVSGGFCETNSCAALVAEHGFVFQGIESLGGIFTQIDFPGAASTAAMGINSAGEIVGAYCVNMTGCSAVGGDHGFRYNSGSFTAIDFPGAALTGANAINDSEQIVGIYNSSSHFHGFLLSGGTFATIDFPGSIFSNAEGINNSGEIVGTYLDAVAKEHGFVYQNGTFKTIDRPGADSTTADGIDSGGRIVGTSTKGNAVQGYVATP